MKKQFSILIVSLVIIGLTLSLFGIVLVSQAAPNEKAQNVNKPIPATDIKVIKKIPFSLDIGETKGRPTSPPGQAKKKNNGSKEAATGVLGEPLVVGANKYAVLIGICDYPGTDYDICLSDGDALNMYDALVTLYGYDPANIYLLRDMEATYGAVYNAVEDIKAQEETGDEVVFFFSGHGGNGIAADGDSEAIDEAIIVHDGQNLIYLWDGQLRSWFSDFETSRIAFVFDTCLAGGQDDVAAEGRVVAMATGENQVAYVYSTGEEGEGVFSHYFVNEGMLQGLGDKYDHDNDGILGEGTDVVVEEAFDYANEIIPNRLQRPEISDLFTDDLLL